MDFDKEFEAAPDADFDAEFEQAEDVAPKTTGDKLANKAKKVLSKGEAAGNLAMAGGEYALESAADLGAGVAQGATFGAADEIGGGLAALIEKGLGYIPGTGANELKKANEIAGVEDDSLVDMYRQYQGGSEKAFKEASDRSPVLNTVGDIGGSIVSGIAAPQLLMGKLGLGAAKGTKSVYDIYKNKGALKAGAEFLKRSGKNLAVLAPEIAAEGALRSEGNLIGGTDEEQTQVMDDTVGALSFGLPAVLGLDAVTEVAAPAVKAGGKKVNEAYDNFAKDHPFLRKMGIGFDKGMQGNNPLAESGIKKLEAEQMNNSQSLMEQITTADQKLGQEVGNSLKQAEAAGQILDIGQPISKALNALDYSYKTFQDINENSRGRQIFSKIMNGMGDATPTEAHDLLKDVDAFIGKFQAVGNKTSTDMGIIDSLMRVRRELSESMKNQISGYRDAASRFEEFRRLVPETIMSGAVPQDISGVYMGKLKNADAKLFKNLDDMTLNATAQGSGSSEKRKAFINAERGVSEFMQNDLARGVDPVFDGKNFLDNTKKFSDEANYLKDVQTVKSPFVNSNNVIGAIGQFGHSGALAASTMAGRVAKPLSEISRNAYKMPAEKLNALADKMQNVPGLQSLGQALKDGVANGDQAKKNAALFSILQNPSARLLLDEDENDEMQGN